MARKLTQGLKMKFARFYIAVIACFVSTAAAAQHRDRDTAPPLPAEMDSQERTVLTRSAYLISKGQFDQASAALKLVIPQNPAQIYVDWTPVPRSFRPGYRKAVESAMNAWNQSLAGAVQFKMAQREEDA